MTTEAGGSGGGNDSAVIATVGAVVGRASHDGVSAGGDSSAGGDCSASGTGSLMLADVLTAVGGGLVLLVGDASRDTGGEGQKGNR